jgi:hypothetical protein
MLWMVDLIAIQSLACIMRRLNKKLLKMLHDPSSFKDREKELRIRCPEEIKSDFDNAIREFKKSYMEISVLRRKVQGKSLLNAAPYKS